MFATFFQLVPTEVSLAIDLVVLAVVGPAVWLYRRHQVEARRDLAAQAQGGAPAQDVAAGGDAAVDAAAEDDRVLVGAD